MDFELVKWENKYLHDFIDATSDPHLTDNMCEVLPCPMDTAFAAEYIRERMLNSEECQICRAVVSDGRLVGGVDVIFGTGLFQKNAELSVWIAEDFRGQGLGAYVIAKMCADCFDNYDIIRIEAHPFSDHAQSIAALKKAGFQHEGTMHKAIFKNNRSYDYQVFALVR